jgi:hypothetical protein
VDGSIATCATDIGAPAFRFVAAVLQNTRVIVLGRDDFTRGDKLKPSVPSTRRSPRE